MAIATSCRRLFCISYKNNSQQPAAGKTPKSSQGSGGPPRNALQKRLEIANGRVVLKEPPLRSDDLSANRAPKLAIGAQARRDDDIISDVFSDARLNAQPAAEGLRDAAPKKLSRQRHDGYSERKRL